jgi:hypothetical protein
VLSSRMGDLRLESLDIMVCLREIIRILEDKVPRLKLADSRSLGI